MDLIEILYESPRLVVCVKKAGVLSQSGKPGERTMLALLGEQLGAPVYPVHRLDREVGGVMVYAKTAEAAAELSRQVQQGQMKKEYLAVVQGSPAQTQGVLEDLLYHDAARNKSYVVKRMRKGVKQARLSYRVLGSREGQTLLQVRLFTGRTHQIRVQFASRGVPLVGDGRYGGGSGKLALWSVRLSLRQSGGQACSYARMPEALGSFSAFPDLEDME